MSDLVSVDDRLPTSRKLRRYRVKTIEGSVDTQQHTRVMLGKMTGTGFRFYAGDWQRVTHWYDETEHDALFY